MVLSKRRRQHRQMKLKKLKNIVMIILKGREKMKFPTYEEVLAEHMKDPEFRKEWEASEEEYQKEVARIRAEIEADKKAGIIRHPTYEEAVALAKGYSVANA